MMRRVLKLLSCLGIAWLAIGCQETPKRATIHPPKEDFHVPPDGLFNKPVKYPDEMLNNVTPRRKKDDDKLAPPSGFGGAGAGGAGMNPGMR